MTIAEHLAPSWITRLREQAPEMAVSLQVHNSTDVAQAVEDGLADLGFLESPSVRSTLRGRQFGWDTLCVAVAPSHPWARRGTPVTARELAQEPLLVRESGSGTRETIDDALAAQGLVVTPALPLASNAALKSSATVGIGPAVLSELSLVEELRTGHLVKVEVEGLDLRRPLSVVWRGAGTRPGDRCPGVGGIVPADGSEALPGESFEDLDIACPSAVNDVRRQRGGAGVEAGSQPLSELSQSRTICLP